MLSLTTLILIVLACIYGYNRNKINTIVFLLLDYNRRRGTTSNITMSDNNKFVIIKNTFNGSTGETFYVPCNSSLFRYIIKASAVIDGKETNIPLVKMYNCYLGTDVSPKIIGCDSIIVTILDRTTSKEIMHFTILTEDTTIGEAVNDLIETICSFKRKQIEIPSNSSVISEDEEGSDLQD